MRIDEDDFAGKVFTVLWQYHCSKCGDCVIDYSVLWGMFYVIAVNSYHLELLYCSHSLSLA